MNILNFDFFFFEVMFDLVCILDFGMDYKGFRI
jgi:hypothetical protein